jgi:hypothetical protein
MMFVASQAHNSKFCNSISVAIEYSKLQTTRSSLYSNIGESQWADVNLHSWLN